MQQIRCENKYLVSCYRKESKSVWGLLNVLVHLMTQMSTSSFIQPEVLETPLDLGTGEIQTVFAVEANVNELFVYPNTHQTSILVPWSH